MAFFVSFRKRFEATDEFKRSLKRRGRRRDRIPPIFFSQNLCGCLNLPLLEVLSVRIIPFDSRYRDNMIFMILQAKDALGRVPALNSDLPDIPAHYLLKGDMFWPAIDDNNRVVGSLGDNSVPGTDEVRLHCLYVKAGHKHQGIGSRLLQTAEQHIALAGKRTIRVHLGDETYFEPYRFYPKYGYIAYAPRCMDKQLLNRNIL